MEDPALFVLTILAILGTPGPTNTLLATGGATVGWRRALVLMPAEATGYLIAVLFIGLVLGPVVARSPMIGTALRMLVAVYLLVLALRLWRRGGAMAMAQQTPITPRQVFVTTLLNPKSIVFALGVMPFGSPHLAIYFAAFLGLVLSVAFCWIVAGAAMGRMAHAAGRSSVVPRVGASAIGVFAVLLIVSPFLR
jgi:threonine/homoserine/homoserine lactone efflux protein